MSKTQLRNRLYVFQIGTEVWGVTAEGFGLAHSRMKVQHPAKNPVLVFSIFTTESQEVPVNFSEVEKDETPSIILTPVITQKMIDEQADRMNGEA